MKIRLRVAFSEDHYLEVPTKVTSHNLLKSVDLTPRQDILIARLAEHSAEKKCLCFSCNLTKNNREINWIHTYIRFDIGIKNVSLSLQDGDMLLGIRRKDIEKWALPLRSLGFPVGEHDLFRFAAPLSLPPKKEAYFFAEDYFIFNKEKYL